MTRAPRGHAGASYNSRRIIKRTFGLVHTRVYRSAAAVLMVMLTSPRDATSSKPGRPAPGIERPSCRPLRLLFRLFVPGMSRDTIFCFPCMQKLHALFVSSAYQYHHLPIFTADLCANIPVRVVGPPLTCGPTRIVNGLGHPPGCRVRAAGHIRQTPCS